MGTSASSASVPSAPITIAADRADQRARCVTPGDGRQADRRALDDQRVVRARTAARRVAHARVGPDVVAVERPVGLGMEGPQPVGAGQLEMAEAAVRVGLEQERVDDVRPARHDLAPAPPLAALGDRPGHDRPVRRAPPPPRGAGRPGHRPTAGVAEVASISSSVAAVQRAAAASSSPGQRRRRPGRRRGPRARGTRARSCRARGRGPAARRPRTAGRRRRRPTSRRAAPRSRRAACPSRSRSAPTRRPRPAIAGAGVVPSRAAASSRSALLNARRRGFSPAPSSSRTVWTVARCSSKCASEASTTSTRTSARLTSSRVARKASTSWCGSLWMKPTVSVTIAVWPSPSLTWRLVGSSVANSLSSAFATSEPTQRVEQRRLAGVRVADDADGRPQPPVAAAGGGLALLADLLDPLLHLRDARPDDPAVGLELALARAPRADAALGPRQVGPQLASAAAAGTRAGPARPGGGPRGSGRGARRCRGSAGCGR